MALYLQAFSGKSIFYQTNSNQPTESTLCQGSCIEPYFIFIKTIETCLFSYSVWSSLISLLYECCESCTTTARMITVIDLKHSKTTQKIIKQLKQLKLSLAELWRRYISTGLFTFLIFLYYFGMNKYFFRKKRNVTFGISTPKFTNTLYEQIDW